MGLIHRTSKICQNPTVIIRTTPYFTWIKRFIKASKKLLNPTSSLHCRTLYENEHVPQIRHSHNYIPTLVSQNSSLGVLQRNLSTSPQTKLITSVPKIFNFSDANYFADSQRLFLDKSQTPQTVTSLPVAVLPKNFGQNLIQYHQDTASHNTNSLSKSPLPQLISDTAISYTPPKTDDGFKPCASAAHNTGESFDKIMADIIKQSSPSEVDGVEPVNFHEGSMTDGSWTENTTDLDKHRSLWRMMSNGPQDQYITKSNLSPNFSLSEGEESWRLFTSGSAANKIDLPMEPLLQNDMYAMPPFESGVPKPGGIIEIWNSPEYYALSSQDQPVTVPVRVQDHPVSDANRVQILPMDSIGMPLTPKLATYESINLEAKSPPHPN